MADSISNERSIEWIYARDRFRYAFPRKMELHPIIDEHLFAILINCSSRVAYLLVSLKKEEKEREKKEIRFISIERQPEEENRCYLPMLFPAADCKCQKEKV